MDKRALEILFDTYWSSAGWKPRPVQPPAADFDYAKSRHVMFDPLALTHDEAIWQLREAAGRVTPRQAADAFLGSLSTRRLDQRSALGSHAFARHLQPHEWAAERESCPLCGLHGRRGTHDLNVLNFGRWKWGGVRHTDPVYAWLDLSLFLAGHPPSPTDNDVRIFRELIERIAAAPASTTSSTLHTLLAPALKSNKAERDQLVAILGLCGVLRTPAHPSFSERFVPAAERSLPSRRFVDMAYPACWWTGSDGLDRDALQAFFGHVL